MLTGRQEGLKKLTIDKEFEGAIVMTKYGHRKTYKVTAIDRTLTPLTCIFDSDRGK